MSRYGADYQRGRWLKPNAELWIRPDARHWLMPNQRLWMGPRAWAAKYSLDQPRDDHGRWTNGGGGIQGLDTAPDQESRSDLSRLENVSNDRAVRSEIESSWAASRPDDTNPQEHGFWICKDKNTGDLFPRPFISAGGRDSITPGPMPDDAIAFFHTHPNNLGYEPGPSRADINFARSLGIPGILRSHRGMYYFGPPLR